MSSSAPDVDLKSRGITPLTLAFGVAAVVGAFLLNRNADTASEVADDAQEVASWGSIIIGWLLWLVLRLSQLIAMLFVVMLGALVAKQRSILYVPVPPGTTRSPKDNPHTFRSPQAWNLPFEDVTITTEDGTKINAWFVYQDSKGGSFDDDIPYTMLYFHGNAGNIGHRLENIRDMHRHLGVNVLILDYRGYGDSEDGPGPTEAGFFQDAMASFKWLLERAKTPSVGRVRSDRIIFFGRSIGGAVACKLAAELLRPRREEALFGSGKETHAEQLALPVGLVLENTFTSLRDMAMQLFPFLRPLRFLLRSPLVFDEWRSVDSLTYFASNHEHWCCCLFSGLQDQIVPPQQMCEIHALLKGHRPKVLKCFQFPHGGHNDTPQRGGQEYWSSFNKYMALVRETEPDRLTALKQ